MQKLGIPILCQTVLLKRINDDLNTLKRLFETLIDQGILPYYLHQLDRVEGATHFEVAEEKGWPSSTHPFDVWFKEQLNKCFESTLEQANLLLAFDARH